MSSTLDTFTWILKVTSSSNCLTLNLPIPVFHPPITTCVHLAPPSDTWHLPQSQVSVLTLSRPSPLRTIHHQALLILFPNHLLNLPKCLHPHYQHTVQALIIYCLDLCNNLLMGILCQLGSP